MFEAGDWADEDVQPQLSALSLALVQSLTNKPAKPQTKCDFKKEKQKKKPTKKFVAKRLALCVDKELDKMVNSPSATNRLLDDTEGENEDTEELRTEKAKKNKSKGSSKIKSSSIRKPGYLLKIGEKFSSQEAFTRFLGLPGKKKKGLKRQRVDSEETPDANENELANKSEDFDEKSEGEKENVLLFPPPRKRRKGEGLDISKLRRIFAREDQVSSDSERNIHKSLADEARDKLVASRFRFLNEQLYTHPSNAAAKLFSSDSTLFSAYHQVGAEYSSLKQSQFFVLFQGYQHQAKQWPLDPLNVIVTDILR